MGDSKESLTSWIDADGYYWDRGAVPGEVIFRHSGSKYRARGGGFEVLRWQNDKWEDVMRASSFGHIRAAVAALWPPCNRYTDPETPTSAAVDNTNGRKDDQGKVRLELLPFDALRDVADVMTWRCTKSESVPNPYPARNWELGMTWSRLFGAALRHLWAWWMGENGGRDHESGRSHLAHAACCVLFLLAYERRKVGTDDRPV